MLQPDKLSNNVSDIPGALASIFIVDTNHSRISILPKLDPWWIWSTPPVAAPPSVSSQFLTGTFVAATSRAASDTHQFSSVISLNVTTSYSETYLMAGAFCATIGHKSISYDDVNL